MQGQFPLSTLCHSGFELRLSGWVAKTLAGSPISPALFCLFETGSHTWDVLCIPECFGPLIFLPLPPDLEDYGCVRGLLCDRGNLVQVCRMGGKQARAELQTEAFTRKLRTCFVFICGTCGLTRRYILEEWHL